jgi:arylsulfatase A-like enzyme/Flp pilus assembly protein TadD
MKRKFKHKPPYLLWIVIIAAVLAAVLIILKLSTATGKHISAKGLNLLFITLDTTRADRIGAYGHGGAQTPNLDRLAANGVTFEHCYSVVPVTLPAHSSLFTGRYPLGHGVRDNGAFLLADQETTLAEKMKELQDGYQTFAVIAAFVLMSKFGLNQGFDRYDDSLNAGQLITNFDSEINAEQVYGKFKNWFDNFNNFDNINKGENKPFFAWVHFYDPHVPYAPPEPYKSRFGEDIEGRYDGELAYTDVYVGKILDDLETAGKLEQTLVVIVGDHGEAFGEHHEFGHAIFCYQENLTVPLIFYNPAILEKGLRVAQRVSIVDIMPTILEMYGLDIPAHVQGHSFVNLLAGETEEKERTFYVESMHGKEEMGWAPLTGIIDGQYKYISLPEPELYDLSTDTKEKENLFRKKNYQAKQLDKKLMRLVKTYSTAPAGAKNEAGSQRQLSAGDKQHLQSLGYISAFSGKADTNLDPKKGILLKNRLREIDHKIDTNELDQAEADLEQMAREHSKTLLPQYFGSLNRIYKQRNQPDLVLENWKRAIAAFPKNDHFKINLAFEYFQANRPEEAEQAADDILKNNDKYTRAYILKGKIRENNDLPGEAVTFFEKAAALEPENVSLQAGLAKLLGKTGQFKQAGHICDRLLANAAIAADFDIKGKIGAVLTEIRRDEDARKLLTSVTEAGKATHETWNYLGILEFRKKKFQQAEEAYRKSLEMDASAAQTYNNLGTLYLSMFLEKKDVSFHPKAMAAFNKALELNPRLVSALNGRASAYKFANRIQDALKDWKQVLTIKPRYIDVYFNIGVTYLQINAKQEALNYLKQCKDKFYHQLPPPARQRLDRLIRQAGG